MKDLFLGWFVLLPIAASPVLLVNYLKNRFNWIEKHEGILSGIAWFLGMIILYLIYPIFFNIEVNYKFFGYD
jgi:hypothetical protein